MLWIRIQHKKYQKQNVFKCDDFYSIFCLEVESVFGIVYFIVIWEIEGSFELHFATLERYKTKAKTSEITFVALRQFFNFYSKHFF